MFRLDDNLVFCGNFVFSWLISAMKNNNHQKNEVAYPTETPLYQHNAPSLKSQSLKNGNSLC